MNDKILFIKKQHQRVNQLYDGLPYFVHLNEVVKFAKKYIYLIPEQHRNTVILASWAHDLIEDTGLTYNDVKKELGKDVADIVYILSNEKGKNRKERANDKYYQHIRENELANYVKICDRLANMYHSKIYGGDMFDVYMKELSHFKNSIYNGMYDEMWFEFENINNLNTPDIVYPNIDKFDKLSVYRIKLPQHIPASLYKELYSKGVIPKKNLQKNRYYLGKCRNSNVALWNGFEFIYMRTKFGHVSIDTIKHLEDDNGYDLFIPIEEITPSEEQRIKY